MEEWRNISNYDGKYQVSNLGRVRSLKFGKEKILKQGRNKQGYFTVNLCSKSKSKSFYTHKLVAITFLNHEPCKHKEVIDHIDNNKENNKLSNLRIVTQRENIQRHFTKGISGYRGVFWREKDSKWISYINIGYKRKYIGAFTCKEEANKAYQKELNQLHERRKKQKNNRRRYRTVFKRDNFRLKRIN